MDLSSAFTIKYVPVFIGLLLGGETVLVPAVYLSAVGILNPFLVFTLALAATLISDSLWYLFGKLMYQTRKLLPGEQLNTKRLKQRFIHRVYARVTPKIELLSAAFVKNPIKILVISKFIYGTRTAIQVLSGIYRIPYRRYLTGDLTGSILLIIFTFALGFGVQKVFNATVLDVRNILLSFSVFVVLFLILIYGAKKIIEKSWFQ
ncbi:MAG: VTT domain-containing protein [Patescibacteria group bacterium]|nr:VTT domain-containing protein [Patescibacteria group bacterium]